MPTIISPDNIHKIASQLSQGSQENISQKAKELKLCKKNQSIKNTACDVKAR